jgi:diaminopimelate epimerase
MTDVMTLIADTALPEARGLNLILDLPMPILFRKMHAHGDDFVVVDRRGQDDPITSDMARRLGNRSPGIGFNQLAVILDCNDAEARLVFWNPDGSPLNACGSATRGVADILMREMGARSVSLRTNRGLLQCERTSNAGISVSMGEPLLEWRDIPLATPLDTLSLPIDGGPSACSREIPTAPSSWRISVSSMWQPSGHD